jgi:tagatose 6-phosphate kinase
VIVTLTLNAALDMTYRIEGGLAIGKTNRVHLVAAHVGGKGTNVARVLHSLGEDVMATGLLGGCTGARIRSLLDADGVRHQFETIADESRRTTAVADDFGATRLWEPGPLVTDDEWHAFLEAFTHTLRHARTVVLAGSLPPGVPIDAYAQLIGVARDVGVYTILDADGTALRHGIGARPDLVKPNAAELVGLTGEPVDGVAQGTRAARSRCRWVRQRSSPRSAMLAWSWSTPTARGTCGRRNGSSANPMGAGDACTALARSVERPWTERLADAVAMSAASVAAPVAGVIDQRRTYGCASSSRLRRASHARTDCGVVDGRGEAGRRRWRVQRHYGGTRRGDHRWRGARGPRRHPADQRERGAVPWRSTGANRRGDTRDRRERHGTDLAAPRSRHLY